MAKLWSLTHTTPGAIAGCATLARWGLSKDVYLQEKGAETAINWMDQFEAYLQYLLVGLAAKRESVLNIFRTWDDMFFPNGKDSLAGKVLSSSTAESTRDALAALAEDTIADDIQSDVD